MGEEAVQFHGVLCVKVMITILDSDVGTILLTCQLYYDVCMCLN